MLKKIVFKAGVNRENSRYYTEGGYYECDKIRFRQGTPQKIGGWQQISGYTFLGVCRSLWNWLTLGSVSLTGVGTNLKFYIEQGGAYYDITPIRAQATLSNPFTATTGSSIIEVSATAHGAVNNDFVTFNGATSLGGNITAAVLDQQYQITYINANSYTIDVGVAANASDTAHGGTVNAVYQINTGTDVAIALSGWGAGAWSEGPWGTGTTSSTQLRLWSQSNFGEDLIMNYRGGPIYYWNASETPEPTIINISIASPAVVSYANALVDGDLVLFSTSGALPTGVTAGVYYYVRNRTSSTFNLSATPSGALINTSGTQSGTQYLMPVAYNLASASTASDVPTVSNFIMVSDQYRFVFAFGCNDYGDIAQNPLLIRWSDQEDATQWTPSATNQAGSLPLSRGSQIIAAVQTRQEIVVFTDTALYVLQYLGPPYVWGSQLMGTNTSIVSQNASILASDVVYWMGNDKFYKYDGRVQTLRCDLREYIFNDFNYAQTQQIFASTVEQFNEVWWFYCSANSSTIDKYVVYNYLEDIWYYGTMARTAWLDTGTIGNPIAATYVGNIVEHESGVDDNTTTTALPIYSYITTSEFDIDDGHQFSFIRRILPDLTFRGSTADSPQVTLSVIPLNNSGSGYTSPPSVGGSDNADITRTAVVPIEEFTGQVFIRVRGRQFSFKMESDQLGCTWQMGAMRLDYQNDGRRST